MKGLVDFQLFGVNSKIEWFKIKLELRSDGPQKQIKGRKVTKTE